MTAQGPPGRGGLIISIDFEMYWGIRDKTLGDQRYLHTNVAQDTEVVERLCALFERYEIRATWASVGLLFVQDHDEAAALASELTGLHYKQEPFNPLPDLQPGQPPQGVLPAWMFAPRSIERISQTPGQELGSHTFSHYYLMEPGQTQRNFDQDCALFARAAKGYDVTSIVFPRNQVNLAYLPTLERWGLRVFRGVQRHWAYGAAASRDDTYWKRGVRLLDKYLPVCGDHSFTLDEVRQHGRVLELPQSRFLAPYSKTLRRLEPLKRRRIRREMREAARRGRYYHLWWHPHNFGRDMDRNLADLEELLRYFHELRQQYYWPSLRMNDFLLDAL